MSERIVKATLDEGYHVVNSNGDHIWGSDEPKEEGGQNHGPKPTELLLSALTSCKLITMKMYAERKGWVVDGIKIELEILEKGDKWLVRKSIQFPDNLTQEQQERLKFISFKCPIAKRLAPSIEYI